MAVENGKDAQKVSPPYLAFRTFLSGLDTLKHGIPNQIDRSVFPSFSGLGQTQLLSAFRFFGLILPDGRPTPELSKAVDEKERQAQIKKLLEKSYPALFALGLTSATPNGVDGEMRKSGLTGDTLEKSKTFFLQAAKYAGVPLSPYLKRVTRTTTAKRKPRSSPRAAAQPGNGDEPVNQVPTSPMKTILLGNGVTLFLGASSDLFSMASEDRKFVLELLDRIEQYEQEHPAAEEGSSEEAQL